MIDRDGVRLKERIAFGVLLSLTFALFGVFALAAKARTFAVKRDLLELAVVKNAMKKIPTFSGSLISNSFRLTILLFELIQFSSFAFDTDINWFFRKQDPTPMCQGDFGCQSILGKLECEAASGCEWGACFSTVVSKAKKCAGLSSRNVCETLPFCMWWEHKEETVNQTYAQILSTRFDTTAEFAAMSMNERYFMYSFYGIVAAYGIYFALVNVPEDARAILVNVKGLKKAIDLTKQYGSRVMFGLVFFPAIRTCLRMFGCKYPWECKQSQPYLLANYEVECFSSYHIWHIVIAFVMLVALTKMALDETRKNVDPSRNDIQYPLFSMLFVLAKIFAAGVQALIPDKRTFHAMFCLCIIDLFLLVINLYLQPVLGGGEWINHFRSGVFAASLYLTVLAFIQTPIVQHIDELCNECQYNPDGLGTIDCLDYNWWAIDASIGHEQIGPTVAIPGALVIFCSFFFINKKFNQSGDDIPENPVQVVVDPAMIKENKQSIAAVLALQHHLRDINEFRFKQQLKGSPPLFKSENFEYMVSVLRNYNGGPESRELLLAVLLLVRSLTPVQRLELVNRGITTELWKILKFDEHEEVIDTAGRCLALCLILGGSDPTNPTKSLQGTIWPINSDTMPLSILKDIDVQDSSNTNLLRATLCTVAQLMRMNSKKLVHVFNPHLLSQVIWATDSEIAKPYAYEILSFVLHAHQHVNKLDDRTFQKLLSALCSGIKALQDRIKQDIDSRANSSSSRATVFDQPIRDSPPGHMKPSSIRVVQMADDLFFATASLLNAMRTAPRPHELFTATVQRDLVTKLLGSCLEFAETRDKFWVSGYTFRFGGESLHYTKRDIDVHGLSHKGHFTLIQNNGRRELNWFVLVMKTLEELSALESGQQLLFSASKLFEITKQLTRTEREESVKTARLVLARLIMRNSATKQQGTAQTGNLFGGAQVLLGRDPPNSEELQKRGLELCTNEQEAVSSRVKSATASTSQDSTSDGRTLGLLDLVAMPALTKPKGLEAWKPAIFSKTDDIEDIVRRQAGVLLGSRMALEPENFKQELQLLVDLCCEFASTPQHSFDPLCGVLAVINTCMSVNGDLRKAIIPVCMEPCLKMLHDARKENMQRETFKQLVTIVREMLSFGDHGIEYLDGTWATKDSSNPTWPLLIKPPEQKARRHKWFSSRVEPTPEFDKGLCLVELLKRTIETVPNEWASDFVPVISAVCASPKLTGIKLLFKANFFDFLVNKLQTTSNKGFILQLLSIYVNAVAISTSRQDHAEPEHSIFEEQQLKRVLQRVCGVIENAGLRVFLLSRFKKLLPDRLRRRHATSLSTDEEFTYIFTHGLGLVKAFAENKQARSVIIGFGPQGNSHENMVLFSNIFKIVTTAVNASKPDKASEPWKAEKCPVAITAIELIFLLATHDLSNGQNEKQVFDVFTKFNSQPPDNQLRTALQTGYALFHKPPHAPEAITGELLMTLLEAATDPRSAVTLQQLKTRALRCYQLHEDCQVWQLLGFEVAAEALHGMFADNNQRTRYRRLSDTQRAVVPPEKATIAHRTRFLRVAVRYLKDEALQLLVAEICHTFIKHSADHAVQLMMDSALLVLPPVDADTDDASKKLLKKRRNVEVSSVVVALLDPLVKTRHTQNAVDKLVSKTARLYKKRMQFFARIANINSAFASLGLLNTKQLLLHKEMTLRLLSQLMSRTTDAKDLGHSALEFPSKSWTPEPNQNLQPITLAGESAKVLVDRLWSAENPCLPFVFKTLSKYAFQSDQIVQFPRGAQVFQQLLDLIPTELTVDRHENFVELMIACICKCKVDERAGVLVFTQQGGLYLLAQLLHEDLRHAKFDSASLWTKPSPLWRMIAILRIVLAHIVASENHPAFSYLLTSTLSKQVMFTCVRIIANMRKQAIQDTLHIGKTKAFSDLWKSLQPEVSAGQPQPAFDISQPLPLESVALNPRINCTEIMDLDVLPLCVAIVQAFASRRVNATGSDDINFSTLFGSERLVQVFEGFDPQSVANYDKLWSVFSFQG